MQVSDFFFTGILLNGFKSNRGNNPTNLQMKGQRNWPKIKPNTRAVERKLPYGAKPKQGESVEEEETRRTPCVRLPNDQ